MNQKIKRADRVIRWALLVIVGVFAAMTAANVAYLFSPEIERWLEESQTITGMLVIAGGLSSVAVWIAAVYIVVVDESRDQRSKVKWLFFLTFLNIWAGLVFGIQRMLRRSKSRRPGRELSLS
jgi:hypothetical protein